MAPVLLSRRRLLGGGVVLLAATVPTIAQGVIGNRPTVDPLPQRLLDLFDASALRRLGIVYVRDMAPGTTGSDVAQEVLPSRYDAASALDAPQEELLAALVEKVQTDYERGLVVSVDGWLLSQTEAGLCALSVL